MTVNLNHKNDRLRRRSIDLWKVIRSFEVHVRDVASRQLPNPTPEQVQTNLQERARAIIETAPTLSTASAIDRFAALELSNSRPI